MTKDGNMRMLPVTELRFDARSPRLAEYGVGRGSGDEDIMSLLWDAMHVGELARSVAAGGYFRHEPLIVAEERGEKVVIDGNRRLAAVRALLDLRRSRSKGWDVPKFGGKDFSDLENLPAVVFPGREHCWRRVGFKHVNGPARWTAYAKAKYIADTHRRYGVSLEDIARQLGDVHGTVRRFYRVLSILEQAKREKVFDMKDQFHMRFSFFLLCDALSYEGIRKFLSVDGDAAAVPKEKTEELGELCLWLYGNRKREIPPVVGVAGTHLPQLDGVLGSAPAVSALRRGHDLSLAFEISRPPSAVLKESLYGAKHELRRFRRYAVAGRDRSEELLQVAGEVVDLADDVFRDVEIARSASRRRSL